MLRSHFLGVWTASCRVRRSKLCFVLNHSLCETWDLMPGVQRCWEQPAHCYFENLTQQQLLRIASCCVCCGNERPTRMETICCTQTVARRVTRVTIDRQQWIVWRLLMERFHLECRCRVTTGLFSIHIFNNAAYVTHACGHTPEQTGGCGQLKR